MHLHDDKMTMRIGEPIDAAGAVFPKNNLPPVGPPVEIPPNEPKKPPVKEPGEPYEKPPTPEIPPVEKPWDVPSKPPVKEPPPEDPNQIPPQPHTLRPVHNRWFTNTAYTP
jgi:hypothetical protein